MLRRSAGFLVRPALRGGGRAANTPSRRGSRRRTGGAAAARRTVLELPLPLDDPGAGRCRTARGGDRSRRVRAQRLKPARREDYTYRVACRLDVGPSRRSGSPTSPWSARTGAGSSGCAWSVSTPERFARVMGGQHLAADVGRRAPRRGVPGVAAFQPGGAAVPSRQDHQRRLRVRSCRPR